MIMILLKSLGKRTSIGSYYDEKSLTKCYWDGVKRPEGRLSDNIEQPARSFYANSKVE